MKEGGVPFGIDPKSELAFFRGGRPGQARGGCVWPRSFAASVCVAAGAAAPFCAMNSLFMWRRSSASRRWAVRGTGGRTRRILLSGRCAAPGGRRGSTTGAKFPRRIFRHAATPSRCARRSWGLGQVGMAMRSDRAMTCSIMSVIAGGVSMITRSKPRSRARSRSVSRVATEARRNAAVESGSALALLLTWGR
jgi:hypothetical protein